IENHEYELVSILGIGMEKVAYLLRDKESNENSQVLKIFRNKISEEYFLKLQNDYKILRDSDIPVSDTRHYYIDNWPVEFERRYALVFNTGVEQVWARLTKEETEIERITKLYIAGAYEDALV